MDSLIISGGVEGVPCRMVVDTGSNITIVRPDILRRIQKGKPTNVKSVECSLRAVTGDTAPVWRRGSLRI